MGLEPEMQWALERYNTNMDQKMELTPPKNLPHIGIHMVIKTLHSSISKNV